MPAENLNSALLGIQRRATTLQKDSINPHFGNTYISLNGLMEQVLPMLNEEGVVLIQAPDHIDGQPAFTTVLMHADTGESMAFTTPLFLDKANSQGHGSAITYTRRYGLMSILGLVADEDDDGNAASPKVVNKKKSEATSLKTDGSAARGSYF